MDEIELPEYDFEDTLEDDECSAIYNVRDLLLTYRTLIEKAYGQTPKNLTSVLELADRFVCDYGIKKEKEWKERHFEKQ
jgi:hypothetical protein